MLKNRSFLLVISVFVVVFVLGGGLSVKVGAAENSYKQVALFADVVALVMDNYVDPVDPAGLFDGAYQGMLGGMDANGAYLSAEEVEQWKHWAKVGGFDPGVSVLKAGRSLQIVAVDPGSSADESGLKYADQIRSIDGRLARDLSLDQARRLLSGASGTKVRLEVLHPADGFRREEVELVRGARRGSAYDLELQQGIAVLHLRDLRRVQQQQLITELADLRSRGVERLLLDLRNLAEGSPRDAVWFAGLFSAEGQLRRRDRSGRLLEAVQAGSLQDAWSGQLAVLTNWATAGGSEALLSLITQAHPEVAVYGESTYGLGTEAKLYELAEGGGMLVSASVWEIDPGKSWFADGIEPGTEVVGQGDDFDEAQSDQLSRVLELLEQQDKALPAAA